LTAFLMQAVPAQIPLPISPGSCIDVTTRPVTVAHVQQQPSAQPSAHA
jgi:hypothetical protein